MARRKIVSVLLEEIDLRELSEQCLEIEELVASTLSDKPQNYKIDEDTPFGTRVADFYNVFCYPSVELNSLYCAIRYAFYSADIDVSKKYYIQGWVNVYRDKQKLDWHRHYGSKHSYHGFFVSNQVREILSTSSMMVNASRSTQKTDYWCLPSQTTIFTKHPDRVPMNRE